MRLRSLPVALLLALALLAPPAHAAHGTEARLVACEPATAVFEGRMRALRGSERLQMRFVLEASTPERPRWTAVSAPGWEGWSTAEPAAERYLLTRRVQGLLSPARYRAVVRFRWLDAQGAVRLRDRRTSPSCRQRWNQAALHFIS